MSYLPTEEVMEKLIDPNITIKDAVALLLKYKHSCHVYHFVESNPAYELICLEEPDWVERYMVMGYWSYHKAPWSSTLTKVYARMEVCSGNAPRRSWVPGGVHLFWKFYIPCVVIPEIEARCPESKTSAERILRELPPQNKLKLVPQMIIDGANPYDVVQKVLGKALTKL